MTTTKAAAKANSKATPEVAEEATTISVKELADR